MVIILYYLVFSLLFSFNYAANDTVKNNNGKIHIKLGHIGAINAMPKAEVILDICKKELLKEGILDDDLEIE